MLVFGLIFVGVVVIADLVVFAHDALTKKPKDWFKDSYVLRKLGVIKDG